MTKELILGFFDGLHHGHELLFKAAKSNFNVLTFKNIPAKNKDFLYEESERIKQLKKMNSDEIHILDLKTHNMSALEFCNSFLNKKFKPSSIIVGSDYIFGNDKQNVEFLKKHFLNVVIIPRTNISTTKIKEFLRNNDFENANKLLLEPYYRFGKVIYGKQIARNLGFPTANIQLDNTLVKLNEGSYIVEAILDEIKYPGIGFVGKSKFFENSDNFIEVHILNFNQNIYNKDVKIIFHKFVRPNQSFSQVADLKLAIENDVYCAKKHFKIYK